jgi:homeobox protein cut-like
MIFQIDNLTNRAKFAEQCFLDLYKELFTVTDPVSVLHAQCLYVRRTDKLQSANSDLVTENRQLMNDLVTLKGQLVNLKALEDKVAYYDKKVETRVAEVVAEKMKQAAVDLESSRSAVSVREKELEAALVASNDKIRQLRQQIDEFQSMSFENGSKIDDRIFSLQKENDVLGEDVERWKQRVDLLERENESLRSKIRDDRSQSTDLVEGETVKFSLYDALQSEYFQRGVMIEKLKDNIAHVESQLHVKDATIKRVEEVHVAAVAERDAAILTLKAELAAAPTKEQVRKLKSQLRVLEAAEFNVDFDDSKNDLDVNAVERMLLARVRRSEADLTHSKLKIKELEDENGKLTLQVVRKDEVEGDLRKLVMKLEGDIESLQKKGSGVGNSIANTALLAAVEDKRNQSIDGSMVQVLTEQRDRIRSRLADMESTNEKLEHQLRTVQSDLSQVKGDNIKLYEKIKYLQTMKSAPLNANQAGEISINVDRQSEVEGRYRHQYEASMNPFAEFSREEKNRQYAKINTAERVILKGSKIFLSNKYARMVLFFYALVLHLMVFYSLFHLTHEAGHTIKIEKHNPNESSGH